MDIIFKRFIQLFLTGSIGISANGQSYLGYNTDNYSGLHGVVTNPANIADARIRADINLFSLSALGANDYVNLSFENISDFAEGSDFVGLDKNPSDRNNLLVNLEVLGPSFMFKFKQNQSIGLITRLRGVNNYLNFNGKFFEALVDGFPDTTFDFQQNDFDGTSHVWAEIGLVYGRILFDDRNKNFIKGGITVKYLSGIGFSQVYSTQVSGSLNRDNQTVELNGNFSNASNVEDTLGDHDILKNLAPGFGFDIGVVYEYRTRSSQSYNGRENPDAVNNYRFKLGVSLLDFGAITYNNIELKSYILDGAIDVAEAEDDIIVAIEDNFQETREPGDVTMALPTSLNINIDYKFSSDLYLNLDVNQTLVNKDKYYNNNRLNLISLTPRFERRKLGFYLPIGYSTLGKYSMGIGMKLGPLVIGLGSILGNALTANTQTANFYLGFKAPLHYKRR
ncbi:DUF5723 family protein [Flagellimonas crocea]|uniref:DUF5723 family protein n=1 Tax=Flagellimonas crocea TaxID=3067311 RepID=UPI00296E3D03|nr:DUF5723 family protein [Muricauda sp. DH64]